MPAHADHPHQHGPGCGHVAIRHGDHVDYLHDGHLHTDRAEECSISVDAEHPDTCRPCSTASSHQHGPGCGHPSVPHGDHTDWLVDGRLQHMHGGHCDDHGAVDVLSPAPATTR
jgi:hypothetical protein